MQITRMELIFLNSITPGSHIWGIPLKLKKTGDFKDIYQTTIDGLKEKGLLESDTKLSVLGGIVAKMVDDYKQANQYALINRMHIALLPNLDAVIIVQTEPGIFEIIRQNRVAILVQILRSYEEFCAAGDKWSMDMFFPLNKFLEEIEEYPGNLLLGKFSHNRSTEEGVIFWNKKNIYYYDVKKEKKHHMSAPQVRNFLASVLEVREETANG